MYDYLQKNILFFLGFVSVFVIHNAYRIFYLGMMDRKFSNSPWSAFEVYCIGTILDWFLVILTFIILNYINIKYTKLPISNLSFFLSGLFMSAICYTYNKVNPHTWQDLLNPDRLGSIFLIFIFVVLFLFFKFKNKESKL